MDSAPTLAGSGIPDVQGQSDSRRVAIDKVGVKDVLFPLRLRVAPGHAALWGSPEQHTVAKISTYVSLPHARKGTHMSRFIEVLNAQAQGRALAPGDVPALARLIRQRLDASESFLDASFSYFIRKLAPVSGAPGLIDYRVRLECSSSATGEDLVLTVQAPATSLCPCSKEISAYGAHNQRCLIEASVRTDPARGPLWIEDLAGLLETAASAQVYAVLKRPDEKRVTEAAYENPKFVEDTVRDLALALEAEPRVRWYRVNSENFESIHNHSAYAEITRDKSGGAAV